MSASSGSSGSTRTGTRSERPRRGPGHHDPIGAESRPWGPGGASASRCSRCCSRLLRWRRPRSPRPTPRRRAAGSGSTEARRRRLDPARRTRRRAARGAGARRARRAIASTTKLMTAYLALRDLPLDRKLDRAPPYDAAAGGVGAGLIEGEQLTVRDLLVAMMLPSANDAAATVARGLGLRGRVRRRDERRRRRARLSTTPATRTRSASTTRATTRPPATSPPWRSSCARTRRFREIVDEPEATLEQRIGARASSSPATPCCSPTRASTGSRPATP